MRLAPNRMKRRILGFGLGLFFLAGSALAQDTPPAPEEAAPDEQGTPDGAEEDELAIPDGAEESDDRPPDAPRGGRRGGGGGGGGGGGRGIALSEDGLARLHLRLDSGVGFDANPYSVPYVLYDDRFVGDIIARVRPGLQLQYPGSLIAFDGQAFLDYGLLPDAFNAGQNANFLLYQSLLRANLQVNRGGMFTGAVANTFSFNADPGAVALGSIFSRLNNQLRLGLGFRPGGGMLQFRLAYGFGFEKWFDPFLFGGASEAVRQGVFDQMSHQATLRVDYRFLPRTGVFFQAQGGWHTYPFNDTNPDSFPLGARVGLMGQFTPKLSGAVSLGYDNPLVVERDPATLATTGIATTNLVGVAGQAELRWAVTSTTRLGGGVSREFRPAPLYQFVANNRVYLRFDQAIGAKFVFSAFAAYSLLGFGEEQAVALPGQAPRFLTDQQAGRLDSDLSARANVSYFVLDWLSFGLANTVNWRLTGANDLGSGANLSFFRNETLLLASLHY
jgi:hypothetical protein